LVPGGKVERAEGETKGEWKERRKVWVVLR